jgi:hypothetical protein
MMHLPPEAQENVSRLYSSLDSTVMETVPTDGMFPRTSGTTILPPYQSDTYETEKETAYPRESVITAARNQRESGIYSVPPTVGNTVAKGERENFIRSLPTRVQVKLDQKFGKDRIAQCFKSEACLRHVLIPLYKSGFLLRDEEWKNFREAFHMVKIFLELWDDHTAIDFAGIQGYQKDWDVPTKIDPMRVQMATAALLHFDGDIANTV